jgi:hypothetical protein
VTFSAAAFSEKGCSFFFDYNTSQGLRIPFGVLLILLNNIREIT